MCANVDKVGVALAHDSLKEQLKSIFEELVKLLAQDDPNKAAIFETEGHLASIHMRLCVLMKNVVVTVREWKVS
ncbi:hypothetical protein Ahu01nite_028500 [Winogradskya humida]|uniref:Uncharacterized protein n=1 Tax=Winogradskya humida TaxID=113566 RepID=A0ABQ3ZMM0_9ACTN|nr:hypothetical protein Ahu01nite_028500 [Actinoplanes humidus]